MKNKTLKDFLPGEISINSAVDFFFNDDILVDVCRLDKIHPVISGNKWFKLYYYLEQALAQHTEKVITFGGAYSNHIHATAEACRLLGLPSMGIIRGEEPATYSPTLTDAKNAGMQLLFVSREAYASKKISPSWQGENSLLIPEGGYGTNGAEGFATAMRSIDLTPYTHLCAAVGTGTMLAGMLMAAQENQQIIGIPVLKNFTGVQHSVHALLGEKDRSKPVFFDHQYHFGGYAKYDVSLLDFMRQFYDRNLIPSDFVYTGKLFFAIADMLKKNHFPRGSRLLIIHSGGLQGNRSLPKGSLNW